MRRACLRRASFTIADLAWRRTGAVWAFDYTDPDEEIASGERAILVVRDLSSGSVLLSEPVRAADAEATVALLERLFEEHGAPLIAKSDNGGHFTAASVTALLEKWSVVHLLSPARTPTYNGGIESAIGRLKAGIAYVAARNGRDGAWTREDIEETRRLANDTARPRGARGPTPAEAWREKMPITESERDAFRARAAAIEQEIVARGETGARGAKKARRDSIRRAAMEWGILVMGRRRIRLSKRQVMRARIS